MHKEIRGLHQAAYILAIFTFGSQILALIRDRLLAHQFGASVELDLYYTAFRIPDMLYVFFASTLSVYVLIPFISERIEKGSEERARYLLSQIFSLFIFLYSGVAICVMIYAPYIVEYFFSGFEQNSTTLVLLMRIVLIQPLLLGISSLYGVITQMHHRFIVYAIGPLLYNIGIIMGLILLYPYMGITGIVIGVVLGAFGHVCIQLPYVLRTKLMPFFVCRFEITEIIRVCRTSWIRACTLSLHQLILLVFLGFASNMAVGSVSVFQFAFNLQSVPLAIIGVSYSVAAFPLLAQLYAEKRMDVFGQYISTTLKHIFFWSLPVMALFIIMRAQFVRVVLGTGAFDWNDTRLTAAILAIFIVSLTAQAIHLLIVRALYAVGNTRLPLYVTLFSSFIIMLSAYGVYILFNTETMFLVFFERLMRLEGVSGIEVLALPLGYSCGLMVHSFCMLILARKYIHISLRPLVSSFLQSAISALFAGCLAYVVLNYFVAIFETDTFMTICIQGILAGSAGIAGFVVCQYMLGNRELQEIICTCKKRFVQKEVIVVPQDEDHLAV